MKSTGDNSVKYTVNGRFLTQRITGIQRYALELVKELDQMVEPNLVEILVPDIDFEYPVFKNIKLVKYGKRNGFIWEQIMLPMYLSKRKTKGIHLCNVVPLMQAKGIAAIHDVSYKVNPQFFTSVRDRLSAMWHCLNYKVICSNAEKIITVSHFSKDEIMRVYHVSEEKITVIYNAWQHLQEIKEDESVFEKNSKLSKFQYYFMMSSIAKNKNFSWILHSAIQNPEQIYAVAGGGDLTKLEEEMQIPHPENVIYLGYVSDEEAKTLMKYCKAFVFPTLYEGFGIPPLEAIASGAKQIIVSDTPCMHEIYGKYADYIDVYGKSYKMDFNKNHEIDRTILEKYSWNHSARKLLNLIMENKI